MLRRLSDHPADGCRPWPRPTARGKRSRSRPYGCPGSSRRRTAPARPRPDSCAGHHRSSTRRPFHCCACPRSSPLPPSSLLGSRPRATRRPTSGAGARVRQGVARRSRSARQEARRARAPLPGAPVGFGKGRAPPGKGYAGSAGGCARTRSQPARVSARGAVIRRPEARSDDQALMSAAYLSSAPRLEGALCGVRRAGCAFLCAHGARQESPDARVGWGAARPGVMRGAVVGLHTRKARRPAADLCGGKRGGRPVTRVRPVWVKRGALPGAPHDRWRSPVMTYHRDARTPEPVNARPLADCRCCSGRRLRIQASGAVGHASESTAGSPSMPDDASGGGIMSSSGDPRAIVLEPHRPCPWSGWLGLPRRSGPGLRRRVVQQPPSRSRR